MKETFKEYVTRRKAELKEEVSVFQQPPTLVIVNIGDDLASQVYIKGKLKDAEECGIPAQVVHFDINICPEVVYTTIEELNYDPTVTGFIVQLPVPKQIDVKKIFSLISPEKDVDGFSKLAITNPATPQGIIDYLSAQGFEFKNKNAVVLGRSEIVGKPLARLLLDLDCNVTVLHSKTSEENKRLFLENADLVCSAVGKRNVINSTYKLKPTATIIDIGMNRNDEGKVCGDIEEDLPVAFQSHNPGSTGLTTRLALLTNLMKLTEHQAKQEDRNIV